MTRPATQNAGTIALQAALALVTTLFSIALLAGMWFLCGYSLNICAARLFLLAACSAGATAAACFDRQHAGSAIATALVVVAIALLVSKYSVDTSYDGQEYHYLAIFALTHGWNPDFGEFQEHLADWMQRPDFPAFYAKAGWSIAAVEVLAGVTVETAKNASVVLPAAACLACFGVLRKFHLGVVTSLALAVLIAANPVVLQELLLRMNDGQISSLTTLVLACSVLAIQSQERRAWWLVAPSLGLLLTLKSSGLPVMFVLCLALIVAAELRSGWRPAVKVAASYAGTATLAILVIGYSPYVTNVIRHGNIFYPMDSSFWKKAMQGDIPPALEQATPLKRLFLSYAARTGYEDARPKIPLTVNRDELQAAGDVEVMVGGLGPLFSGALLLSLIITVRLLLPGPQRPPLQTALLLLLFGLLCATLPLPHAWYTRYVPHLWLVPLVVAMAAMTADNLRWRLAGGCVTLILAANVLIVAYSALKQDIQTQRAVGAQARMMAKEPGAYCVAPSVSPARMAYFANRGLTVRPVATLRPEDCVTAPVTIELTSMKGMLCHCR
jgi:hypothetical protein